MYKPVDNSVDNWGGLCYTNYHYMKTIYISKIQRVGSSSAVVIPVDVLNGYNWQRGDYVVFGFAGDNSLFIKKLSDRELEELKPKFITI